MGALAVCWLTDRVWSGAVAGIAGMVLAGWHAARRSLDARAAVERAEQARASLEQALRRSQQMEALGRLTAGVAHDFNNHLTAISSNVEMLARRLDSTQGRLLRHTDAAMQGVQRAAALTGRLLSFARQSAADPEVVDADRLLAGLADLLRRTVGDRISLDIVPSQQPWFTQADVNQMENALLSLVVIACDQVRDGGRLTIAVVNVHSDQGFGATYAAVPPGEYIQISIGEPAGTTAWLAADDLTSADLSMARGFARDSGGFLLRSTPAAGGLALRLFLPRYAPHAPVNTVSRRAAGGPTTILVVEDDAAVRGACVEILRDLDYTVLEAPDAMEAFRLIADHGGIDLLFTDLGLPGGVSGRALAEAARNVDAGMRVVFTTGYERADLPDHSGTVLLRKPFNPAQLAAMVRAVMATDHGPAPAETVRG